MEERFLILEDPPPGSWRFEGACKNEDTNAFFPTRETNADFIRNAKLICRGCPVLEECKEYALKSSSKLSGIWGGLTQRERRAINKYIDYEREKRMGLR